MVEFKYSRFKYQVLSSGHIFHKPYFVDEAPWSPSGFKNIEWTKRQAEFDSNCRNFLLAYEAAIASKHPVDVF